MRCRSSACLHRWSSGGPGSAPRSTASLKNEATSSGQLLPIQPKLPGHSTYVTNMHSFFKSSLVLLPKRGLPNHFPAPPQGVVCVGLRDHLTDLLEALGNREGGVPRLPQNVQAQLAVRAHVASVGSQRKQGLTFPTCDC